MLAVPNRKDDMMTTDRSRAEQRLMNKAVHYLGRYSASRQRLREVLQRFAMRKLEAHEEAEVARAIDAVLDDCIRLGYVDDAAFALSRARNKRRNGGSAVAPFVAGTGQGKRGIIDIAEPDTVIENGVDRACDFGLFMGL